MDTRVRIRLRPVTDTRAPCCDVTVGYITRGIVLDQEQWLEFMIRPDQGSSVDITVRHRGKTEAEYQTLQALAITIEEIEINGIADPRFVWQGQFHPEYPHWEPDRGALDTHYLGFNGTWRLTITIPAYTWMHQILGLGWIYD
ncbi:MAG: hypothetical protein EB162_05325 [Euryarchaeota archaeon]|nr:hypothetical protein [Euryarchaeota archaeon]